MFGLGRRIPAMSDARMSSSVMSAVSVRRLGVRTPPAALALSLGFYLVGLGLQGRAGIGLGRGGTSREEVWPLHRPIRPREVELDAGRA